MTGLTERIVSCGRPKPRSGTIAIAPAEAIERHIHLIRGHKLMLDVDLARLYGVTTSALNQAVKRNRGRFPEDFMFPLNRREFENWRSHFVTSNPAARMGLRRRPHAFIEQGVAMLSSVLRSDRAVMARKLAALEQKYDARFRVVFDAIKGLMEPSERPVRQIGFRTPESGV